MQLIELKDDAKERYQSFVKTNGSFLQDWDWGAFQESLGREVSRYLIEQEGEAVLSAQAIKNSTPLGKVYLFLPYGPVFAAALSEQQRTEAFLFLTKALETKFKLGFLRFEPMQTLGHLSELKKTIDNNPHQTLILDITKTPEDLLAGMHHKTRYNIRVAQKHGVQIRVMDEIGGSENPFEESAKRAGIKGYSLGYYNKMLDFFSDGKNIQAKLYTAWHEQDLLATNLMLYWHGTMIYLFGGSVEKKRNVMPTYLLHWQAILDAKARGFKRYDFWGVETDPNHPWYGFSKFKLGFNGELKKYEGTWDFVLRPAWYNVYKFFRAINRKIR